MAAAVVYAGVFGAGSAATAAVAAGVAAVAAGVATGYPRVAVEHFGHPAWASSKPIRVSCGSRVVRWAPDRMLRRRA
jgi:hypothetical protein